MGIFDFLKKKEIKRRGTAVDSTTNTIKSTTKAASKSEKDLATERGEPYVAIIGMDVDPNNLSAGSFELDWNDKFILQLQRFGYQGKSDADLVDQWFTNVCRNVVLETYEQEQADPENRNPNRFVQNTKMDDGKREYR